MSIPLDPIDPTPIAPGLVAIPLTPTPWDQFNDGQVGLTQDGTVWQRRHGLWHRHPWWQSEDADQIRAVCSNPGEWAYDMGWTLAQVEATKGPIEPITLPPSGVSS